MNTTPSESPEVRATEPGTSQVSWDPFDRFAGAFAGVPDWFGARWPERFSGGPGAIKIEEFMEEGALVIRGEIPGVDPEKDIEISVDHGRLTIRASREHREETTADGYRSEFHYGSYARVLTLPDGADPDNIEASYTDGILDLRVPIDPQRQTARKISVTKS